MGRKRRWSGSTTAEKEKPTKDANEEEEEGSSDGSDDGDDSDADRQI